MKKVTVPIGQLAGVHPPAADADRDGGGEQPGQLDDGQVPGRDLHRAHVGVEQAPVPELEAGRLHVLAAERLDDAHAGDALLQLREGVADAVAHIEVGGVRLALEPDAGQHDEGHADQAQQQELPRHDRQHDDRHDEEEAVAHEHEQPHLHELLQRVHVAGHPGHDDPGLLAVVEGHRQALEVVEHPQAQVAEERLADAADQQDLEPVGDVGDAGDHDVADDRGVEGAAVVRLDALVDPVLHEERPGQGGARPHHHHARGRRCTAGGRAGASAPARRRRCLAASASRRSPSSTPPCIHMSIHPRDRRRALPRRGPRGRQALESRSDRWVPSATTRPSLEQHDPVGQRDGGRTVGDDDRGAAPHHLGEGVADLVLLGRVDRRGGVVEDQHARVGEDRPGDGDALALAAREREPPLPDGRVVALGQRAR